MNNCFINFFQINIYCINFFIINYYYIDSLKNELKTLKANIYTLI